MFFLVMLLPLHRTILWIIVTTVTIHFITNLYLYTFRKYNALTVSFICNKESANNINAFFFLLWLQSFIKNICITAYIILYDALMHYTKQNKLKVKCHQCFKNILVLLDRCMILSQEMHDSKSRQGSQIIYCCPFFVTCFLILNSFKDCNYFLWLSFKTFWCIWFCILCMAACSQKKTNKREKR